MLNRPLHGWHRDPHSLYRDQNGQMRWGDGTLATREMQAAYETTAIEHPDSRRTLETKEIEVEGWGRCRKGYATLFKNRDMSVIMKEIDRAEAVSTRSFQGVPAISDTQKAEFKE